MVFDGDAAAGTIDYPNVGGKIGLALSRDASLIGPLTETLGIEDLEDVVEVIMVDAHNRNAARKAAEKERK